MKKKPEEPIKSPACNHDQDVGEGDSGRRHSLVGTLPQSTTVPTYNSCYPGGTTLSAQTHLAAVSRYRMDLRLSRTEKRESLYRRTSGSAFLLSGLYVDINVCNVHVLARLCAQ